jgi:3-isopropylmalate dehydrogenase
VGLNTDMQMKKTIAVLEGDGIGPEIVREAIKVLEVVAQKFNHSFDLKTTPFGAAAYYSHGDAFPEETKKLCDEADVIIKGPVGLAVDLMESIPQDQRPEIAAILPLRKRYDTFANYRPVRLPKTLAAFSPLKKEIIGEGIDILMIRELVGGIYFGKKTEGPATRMEFAKDDCLYTEAQIRRVAHVAFDEAQSKNALMTNIHKANVLATSRFWKEIVEDVAKEYPNVEYQSMLVDNAAFQLVKNPTQFNGMVLLENMQGDILTDQAGGILGSLGLMPSACIGPEKGYVEAAHGSAPDIANQNKANPYSMIGSIAFLYDKCLNLKAESEVIWQALFEVFERGYTTVELAHSSTETKNILSTSAFGDMVVDIINS